MKILINDKLKMLRMGAYVLANADSGEFILDTAETDLTNGKLSEICETNKILFSKKATKADLLEAIEEGVEKLKLTIVNEKPASLVVKEIIEAHIEKHGSVDDEDKVMYEIMQTKKFKFKEIGKLFNQAMIDGGYRVSTKDRYETVKAILNGKGFNPADFAAVKAMIEHLVEEVPATEYSQAYAAMRKWAKEAKVDLPKPVKEAAIAGGLKGKIFAHMVKNPLQTQQEFTAFIVEDLEKDAKLADKYWQIFEIAQRVAKATIELQAEEVEETEDE